MRTIALRLTVLLFAVGAVAQNGPPSKGKATSPTTMASPLDGNWQITGNREYKQYPLLSMAIHVNGKQVTAVGDKFITCPTSPPWGNGGSVGLTGEIGPDGSFTLRTSEKTLGKNAEWVPSITPRVTIAGKVPALGSMSWSGTYTITGRMPLTGEPKCSLDQGGAFTASLLPPLTGTFSGKVWMPPGARLKLSITAKQGEFVSRARFVSPETKLEPVYWYLPLTGTVSVEGSSCFEHGTTDAGTYSTYNHMAGELVNLWFKMDDGSDLSLAMVYTDPQGVGLRILIAGVHGGKCDTDSHSGTGTLTRQ